MSDQHASFKKALNYYSDKAVDLARQYEGLKFENLHDWVLDLLPHHNEEATKNHPRRVLDLGAGSGRDAIWFARQGYEVTAVEPCADLWRESHRQYGREPEFQNIKHVDDSLPELKKLHNTNYYDVIWLSAVWMHLCPCVRAGAFNRLLELMRPDALLMFSIRQPADKSRGMHKADVSEVEQLAKKNALLVAKCYQRMPDRKRPDVSWDYIALNRPSDVAEGLSTIRRIIEYDRKTTSYKLGLLRTLCRVADSYPHFVERGDENIQIPLGLVSLIFYQLYHPHIEFQLPQIGGRRQLEFENRKGKLYKLASSYKDVLKMVDLRPGGIVNFNSLQGLTDALKEAAGIIQRGPITYITYDLEKPINQDSYKGSRKSKTKKSVANKNKAPIFSVKTNKMSVQQSKSILKFQNETGAHTASSLTSKAIAAGGRSSKHRQAKTSLFKSQSSADYLKTFKLQHQVNFGLINSEWLKSFGVLDVPVTLWRAFERYSTWIEPSIVFAWQNFIKSLAENKSLHIDLGVLHAAMQWTDGIQHNTHPVRTQVVDPLIARQALHCVWSGTKLSLRNRATDHMMPFKLWPCNDLWNLAPTSRAINAQKSARLPSQQVLSQPKVKERILEWWQKAYIADEVLYQKFIIEARMRLPLWGYAQQDPDLDDIFDGLRQVQRQIKAKTNCPEWSPT